MNCTLEQIAQRIKQAKSVLVVGHMRPDGDAFGSALALACAIEKLGIRAQICDESDIPSNLAFVEGVDRIKKKPQEEYDLFVAVDCSDDRRLGGLQEEFFLAKRKRIDTVNVDHHIANEGFAKYNFVRECAANCMNIATLIKDMGVSFDKKIAEYLLMGLLTDSGNFSHDDVDEEALLLAAELVKAGADICYYNYHLFKSQPKERAALFAKVMGGIRY